MSAYRHNEALINARGEKSECTGTLRLVKSWNYLGERWGRYACRICDTRIETNSRSGTSARVIEKDDQGARVGDGK